MSAVLALIPRMANIGPNVILHRAPHSVWDRPGWNGAPHNELPWALLLVAGGATLAAAQLRRESPARLLLIGLGLGLACVGLARQMPIDAARRGLNLLKKQGDKLAVDAAVDDASADSFPASDPPASTSTGGARLADHH